MLNGVVRTHAKAVRQVRQVEAYWAAKLVPWQVLLAVRLIWEHGPLHVLHWQHD